jgi:endo-1,4-beta-xylanase
LSAAICAAFFLTACDFNDEPGSKIPDVPEVPQPWSALSPLHEHYTGKFLLGNVVSPSDLNGGGVRFNLLKKHFNVLTAENAMKPDALRSSTKPALLTGGFNFGSADSLVNAAIAAGMQVHGHTLVWHQQTPAWMNTGVTRDEAIDNLEAHVTTVVTHFKDKLLSWDVVNEAMRDDSSPSTDWRDSLRKNQGDASGQSKWNTIIGDEYIELAFKAARDADPSAKLYYNDYNLNMSNHDKAYAVYRMVQDINARYPNYGGRKLIDGIGMQSHHHIGTDPVTVEDSIKLFASLNVDIVISELDIQTFVGGAGGLTKEAAFTQQAQKYAQLFAIFTKYADKISRVTFWGIDDGKSWRSSSYPCLFDAALNAKPAFYAVQ